MLGLMKNEQSRRSDKNLTGQRVWEECCQQGETQQDMCVRLFLASLISEVRMSLSSRYRERASQVRGYNSFQGRRVGRRSLWPSCLCCFLRSLQLKIFNMPRCLAPMVKNLPDKAGDLRDKGLIPKLGRSPGIGNSNPLKYSYLENSMDREAWQLQSMGWQRVGHDWARMHTRCYILEYRICLII